MKKLKCDILKSYNALRDAMLDNEKGKFQNPRILFWENGNNP